MDILLRKRVQDWAVKSRGMFQLLEEKKGYIEAQENGVAVQQKLPEFVRWADIWEDVVLVERVKWGKVKSVNRAMEK